MFYYIIKISKYQDLLYGTSENLSSRSLETIKQIPDIIFALQKQNFESTIYIISC